MRRREINWLITIVFIGILTGVAIKSWQYWQRIFSVAGSCGYLARVTRAIFRYAMYLIAAAGW